MAGAASNLHEGLELGQAAADVLHLARMPFVQDARAGALEQAGGAAHTSSYAPSTSWREQVIHNDANVCPPLVNEARRNRKPDVAAPTRTPATE